MDQQETNRTILTGLMAEFNAAVEGTERTPHNQGVILAGIALNDADKIMHLEQFLPTQTLEELGEGIMRVFAKSTERSIEFMSTRDFAESAEQYAAITRRATELVQSIQHKLEPITKRQVPVVRR
jgi:hypothetical protein